MTNVEQTNVSIALGEAVRVLRDIAALDPTRPAVERSERHALTGLERISVLLDERVDARGRTMRPGEDRSYPPLSNSVHDE